MAEEERPKIFPEVDDVIKITDSKNEGEWKEVKIIARGREWVSKNQSDGAGMVPDLDQYWLLCSGGVKLTYWSNQWNDSGGYYGVSPLHELNIKIVFQSRSGLVDD